MHIQLYRFGSRSFIVTLFIVLTVAIIGVEHLAIQYQRKSIGRDAERNLTAIADLKVQQVTSWIGERRASAEVVGRRSLFADQIAQWLKRGAVEDDTASAIKTRLAVVAKAFRYRAVTLVDAQSRPLLGTHEFPGISEEIKKAVAETVRTGDAVILDFHRSVDNSARHPKIDILAPVYARESESSPVAVLIFDIDPETSLHPLVESWPTSSVSAETLLVERHGDRVRYVTDLRHQKDAQFKLNLPIDQADLVEAMGLKGQHGVVTGVDYRGVNVLAVSRPIPDSPWLLVAKIDNAEIYAPIQMLAGVTALVTAILMLVAGVTTIAWMRAQRRSEEKFHGFAEAADQVFWIAKLSPESIEYVNPAFERIWGCGVDDLYRHPRFWTEAIHTEDRPRVVAAFENWIHGTPGARYNVEYRIVRPDGQIRWIADRGFILKSRDRAISRIAGIAEDISEQKRAEEALRQANAESEERVRSRTAELEKSHQELQALTAIQESFQEEERKYIARELHDELAQKLTVLKLQIASLMPAVSARESGLTRQVRDVNSLLTETINGVGKIAARLRPVVLDELGLAIALRDLVEEFSQRTKIECEFSVHPADLSVDNALATPLYRMVQESLTNVARHAQATEVIVSLYRDSTGRITLDVNDNGKGFSSVDQSARKSFGLIGMRERAAILGGEMKIHSRPGAGTSIEIVVPEKRNPPQISARPAG